MLLMIFLRFFDNDDDDTKNTSFDFIGDASSQCFSKNKVGVMIMIPLVFFNQNSRNSRTGRVMLETYALVVEREVRKFLSEAHHTVLPCLLVPARYKQSVRYLLYLTVLVHNGRHQR